MENGSEWSKILFTGGVTVLSSSDPAVSQLHSRTDIYGCLASPCIGSPGNDLDRFEKIMSCTFRKYRGLWVSVQGKAGPFLNTPQAGQSAHDANLEE